MSTNSQENLNWADDRHCFRRRPHPTENGRIHRRNRRANVGPDILELKMDEMNGKAANNWAKEGMGAPLSMNRKKRWELLEAEEFPQFQKPEKGIRVSKVVQRVNPLGRGIGLGKEGGGRLEEENVLEMSSKGGNGRLVEKRSASGRGVNKLAQWFQHNDRPKKGRNRRKGRGLEGADGEEGKPLWMDLFGEEEGEAGKKKKKSGRNRPEEKEGAIQKKEGVHFYYTLKCQMVTPHQMDSGWQYRKQNPQMRIDPIQEETIMEKKFIRRNNLGRKCDLKMGQKYFEEINYSDIENEDSEMELEILKPKLISKKNKRISQEFQMAENVEQKRPKNWWLEEIGPNIIENEEERNEELVEMDWKLEEKIEELEKCKIQTRNLPIGSAIYEGEKIKEIMKKMAEEIPNGALIIRRNGQEKIKWFINLVENEENELENSSKNSSKKRRILDLAIQSKMSREKNKKIKKYLRRLDGPNASKSEWPANENSAEFFRELLRIRDKKHQLDLKLAENWPMDEEEAAQKALALFFDEHKMAIRQKGERDSAFGSEESQSESENGANFCEVCFAECNDATEGFGLPECREGPAMSEHLFCNGCWRKHIKQCLADGKVPIGCMEPRCPSILHPDCALLVVGQSTAENYRRLLIEHRQMRNDFLHCQKCGQLNFLKELDESGPSNLLTICQNCAETICVKCGRRQHLPLKCVQRDLYEHILRANGQSLEYLVPEGESNMATGVRCTKCRNLVEKNQGCDHMTCRCGFQFCWRCGGDWLNHRQCQTEGQITIPLFDNHIFLNPKTGLRFRRMPRHVQVLAKFPEKFLGEYAKIRAPRERNGVKLFLDMEKIFGGNIEEAEKWTVKYMQLSEFVELAMVKSKLAPRNDPLKKSGERLLLNFTSLLIMGNVGNERVEISGEMIESGYTEMLAMCRQMVK